MLWRTFNWYIQFGRRGGRVCLLVGVRFSTELIHMIISPLQPTDLRIILHFSNM